MFYLESIVGSHEMDRLSSFISLTEEEKIEIVLSKIKERFASSTVLEIRHDTRFEPTEILRKIIVGDIFTVTMPFIAARAEHLTNWPIKGNVIVSSELFPPKYFLSVNWTELSQLEAAMDAIGFRLEMIRNSINRALPQE